MKQHIAIFLMLALTACSSGDLQIQTIDFESASVQNCGTGVRRAEFSGTRQNLAGLFPL